MLEDYLVQQPIAIWNSVRGAWEIPGTENLLCEHWELFSQTWPASGMMQNGQVFELPMQVRLTTVSESLLSPILPTPAVNDMGGNKTVEWWDEWTEKTRLKFNNSNGHEPSLNIEMLKLMPTPNTMEHLPARTGEARERQLYRSGSDSRRSSSGNLREDILDLMPTPVAQEGTKAPSQQDAETKAKTGQVWLSNEAKGLANENIGWGKFEPAIRRWEQILGRPAPAPTKPDGKDDAHRLSSKFTEWMMGLPDGWITDCGLSRNEELKAAGNGVVPQQAELALRILLEGITFVPGGGK